MKIVPIASPKTLDQAIAYAICIGPMDETQERAYHILRDFLAQKFSVAYMQMDMWRDGANTMQTPEEILKTLFESLTKR